MFRLILQKPSLGEPVILIMWSCETAGNNEAKDGAAPNTSVVAATQTVMTGEAGKAQQHTARGLGLKKAGRRGLRKLSKSPNIRLS
ncbi:hypothetical protein E2C01_066885 [Portunus trituberculatus]|uniref:Uncharacterized protein n=1 Tax=Portunus trituberculatus TaxID=210409 RepID=A0A5B7HR24_PORTR|nr:hypothetical protein [Portunus trituberculatus]